MLKNIKNIFLNTIPLKTEVYITPKGARWGNLLYFFLRAYIHQKKGIKYKIVYTKHMKELLELFPSLSEFVIQINQLRFFQKKDYSGCFYQEFNQDFTENDINGFIKKYLIHEEEVSQFFKNNEVPNNDSLTINIRRGDFYEKGNSSIYGYNQIDFVKHTLKNHINKHWKKIIVVSDDMKWCKENFSFLSFFSDEIFYPEFTNENHIKNSFLYVANSKNLIITNSTFSFWGAYLSNYIFGSYHKTFCPIFGCRNPNIIEIYQGNPKWKMINDFEF